MASIRAVCIALTTAAVLAGCAAPFQTAEPAPGTPRADVIARMGTPTRAVPLADGERLQYSQQPAGQYAWMVDLDSAGRVLRVRQVLTAAEFQRIVVGEWTRSDVEREFGPPASIDAVGNWSGPILTYRWNDGSDMFYWVYLDADNVVRRAHPGMELRNSPEWD